MRTLKRKEICANSYPDPEGLRAHIEEFIEGYDNPIRLHSALRYLPPEEREQAAVPSGQANGCGAASMSFFRHGEIDRWDHKPGQQRGEPKQVNSPAHPIDESPTGYSLAGCSPAQPDSASPAIDHFQGAATP